MANSSILSSSNRDIRYRADLLISRRITLIVEATIGRHSAFFINVIKVGLFFSSVPVSVVKLLLKQLTDMHSDNYTMPINL